MSVVRIDNPESIKKLSEFINDEKALKVTNKVLSDTKNLKEDDKRFITYMAISYALKKIIPEKKYKKLVIDIDKEVSDHKNLLGNQYKENNKYVCTFTTNNTELLGTKDVYDIIDNLATYGHELYHTKQQIDASEEKITLESFMYSLERVLQRNLPEFYKREYDNLFFEIEADVVGITTALEFLEVTGRIDKVQLVKLKEYILKHLRPNYKNIEDDEYLKNHIRKLLKKLRDYIEFFNKDFFIEYPILKYLVDRNGELESPERLQELIDNTMYIRNNEDSKQRLRLLKILKELSIERKKSSSYGGVK